MVEEGRARREHTKNMLFNRLARAKSFIPKFDRAETLAMSIASSSGFSDALLRRIQLAQHREITPQIETWSASISLVKDLERSMDIEENLTETTERISYTSPPIRHS